MKLKAKSILEREPWKRTVILIYNKKALYLYQQVVGAPYYIEGDCKTSSGNYRSFIFLQRTSSSRKQEKTSYVIEDIYLSIDRLLEFVQLLANPAQIDRRICDTHRIISHTPYPTKFTLLPPKEVRVAALKHFFAVLVDFAATARVKQARTAPVRRAVMLAHVHSANARLLKEHVLPRWIVAVRGRRHARAFAQLVGCALVQRHL